MFLFGGFCVVIVFLALGDLVSTKTRGILPSIFVISLLFLMGYWSGLMPLDIVERVGLGTPLANFAMSLLVVWMGSMISTRRLAAEWRSIVISAAGLAGMVAFLLIFGRMTIGWETVVVATPPLTGGPVAATMMAQAAAERGFSNLAVLATVIYVFQGFVGYPLAAWCLRMEGRRLLEIRETDPLLLQILPDENESEQELPFFELFAKLQHATHTAPFIHIAVTSVVAFAAEACSALMKTAFDHTLHPLVLCFLFGCLAARLGIIARRPMARTGSFGFLVIVITAYIMGVLAGATPRMVLASAPALVITIGIGTAGLVCFSAASGRFLGYSIPMAVALSLTALFGFPPNFLLVDEAARHLSASFEEYDFLVRRMLPQMLVGGFVTVMIASILVATLFVKILG
ncbi:MAG: hypothetical protein LBQ90_05255 [Synergistaceae bacterium]|jgi:hypothetical protein|nr:hypothetical protein [Synergistaceae bacterium]